MTTLELWLIFILCYILIGVIYAIAHYIKSVRFINEKNRENVNYETIIDHYDEIPTTIDGIIIIFFWPFYMLGFICRGMANAIDMMADFLKRHGM